MMYLKSGEFVRRLLLGQEQSNSLQLSTALEYLLRLLAQLRTFVPEYTSTTTS